MSAIKKGSTDVTRYVVLTDSVDGTSETGYTITSLDLQYTRERTAPAAKVDATALAATDTAHTANHAIQIDATSSPGLYRVDWPDAAFVTGADKVILCVTGTGLHPAIEEVNLVDYDPEDSVRLGLTALPNAAADAAGGLAISDAGGLDLDQVKNKTDTIGALTVTFTSVVDADQNITLYRGDDYDGARILTWTVTGYSGYSLTSATATFHVINTASYTAGDTTTADLKGTALISVDGTTVTLTVALTAASKASLSVCPVGQRRNYRYQIQATMASTSKKAILVAGWLTVRPPIEASA